MAGGPLQAADDMVRIITNGMTFGLADKAAAALGEKDTAAKTAAARSRAGIAGDIANVGSEFYGGKGALKLGWNGLKAAAPIARAVVGTPLKALAALGVGGLGLSDYNQRTGGTPAKADPVAGTAAPATALAPRGTANADKTATSLMAALNAVDSTPPTFEDMAHQVSTAQGGLSLRQLGAIADATNKITPKAAKRTPSSDAISQRLQSYYDGLHAQEIASGVPQDQADANWAGRYQDLLKLDPVNPMIRGAGDEE